MKICQCIFSTNRLEFLKPTLEAQKKLVFPGCEVHKIFFDDYPQGRDDTEIARLVLSHGYEEIILHRENRGIGATWREFWNLIRERAFDYIWQQEDDAVITGLVNGLDLIDFHMRCASSASQVVLKRQPWYPHEKPACALESDIRLPGNPLRGEYSNARFYFTPIASLYPFKHVLFDYWKWYAENYKAQLEWQHTNPNEAFVGKALLEGQGLSSIHVKSAEGHALLEHIGTYTTGKKLLPHEPGFSRFAGFDPTKKYCSRTGRPL